MFHVFSFSQNEVKATIILKRTKMREAFDLIKSATSSTITYDTFSSLIKIIDPKKFKNEKQVKVLFELIDFNGNKLLGKVILFKRK